MPAVENLNIIWSTLIMQYLQFGTDIWSGNFSFYERVSSARCIREWRSMFLTIIPCKNQRVVIIAWLLRPCQRWKFYFKSLLKKQMHSFWVVLLKRFHQTLKTHFCFDLKVYLRSYIISCNKKNVFDNLFTFFTKSHLDMI